MRPNLGTFYKELIVANMPLLLYIDVTNGDHYMLLPAPVYTNWKLHLKLSPSILTTSVKLSVCCNVE